MSALRHRIRQVYEKNISPHFHNVTSKLSPLIFKKPPRIKIEDITKSLPINDIVLYSKLARYAYQEPENVIHIKELGVPCQEPKFITSCDTVDAQAYIWRLPNNGVCVTFRGTSSLQDIIHDLDVRLFDMGNGMYVHNGFYRQFESIEFQVTQELNILSPSYIVFCGHSLGGALATIATVYYAQTFSPKKRIECVTLGCPRVGNKAFTTFFDSVVENSWRIYNEQDPVTMIPISCRFEHIKNGLCITDSLECLRIPTDLPWYMRPYISLGKIDYFSPIQDHNIIEYVQRLEKLTS